MFNRLCLCCLAARDFDGNFDCSFRVNLKKWRGLSPSSPGRPASGGTGGRTGPTSACTPSSPSTPTASRQDTSRAVWAVWWWCCCRRGCTTSTAWRRRAGRSTWGRCRRRRRSSPRCTASTRLRVTIQNSCRRPSPCWKPFPNIVTIACLNVWPWPVSQREQAASRRERGRSVVLQCLEVEWRLHSSQRQWVTLIMHTRPLSPGTGLSGYSGHSEKVSSF